jgi:hypothetical protein
MPTNEFIQVGNHWIPSMNHQNYNNKPVVMPGEDVHKVMQSWLLDEHKFSPITTFVQYL